MHINLYVIVSDWFHNVMWPISCSYIPCLEPLCTFITGHICKPSRARNVSPTGKTPPQISLSESDCIIPTTFRLKRIFLYILSSVLGSSLFCFGSVLVWAIVKSSIPNNVALATTIGLGSGYAIARLSYDYLSHVDSLATGKKSTVAPSATPAATQ